MLRKLEEFLFYFLLVAIPFQIRKVIYHPGLAFNEWQSVSLYGTDILLLALFIFWFFSPGNSRFKISRNDQWLLLFVFLAGISIFRSSAQYLSAYHFTKLVEFVLFYFYLKNYAFKKFELTRACLALVLGGFFQSIVGIAQFIYQSDIGLYLFGEGLLDPQSPGIAVFYNLAQEKIMRAYGTTPHPNILSGYLLMSLYALYYLWIYFSKIKDLRFYRLMGFLYVVILFAFFLTFSRTIIFVWLLGTFIMFAYHYKQLRPEIIRIAILTLVIAAIFSVFLWQEVIARVLISPDEEAVELRVYFAEESVDVGWNWFGVGTGNFVNWLMAKHPGQYPYRYQPVHNLYLLIYTEVGLLGVFSFLTFIILSWREFSKSLMNIGGHYVGTIVFSIMFIALFDHFLWTLQQGHFIWWLTLSLILPENT